MMSFCKLFFALCLIAWDSVDASCRASICGYGELENLPNGDFVCHCFAGYKGITCNEPLLSGENPCLQCPCWNSGSCVSQAGMASCQCQPQTTGINCQDVIHNINNPSGTTTTQAAFSTCRNQTACLNNGICQSASGVEFCICINDFTGKNCETKIPLCERKVNPCLNGANCTNNKCDCTNTNFTGELCETRLVTPSAIKGVVTVKNGGGYRADSTLSYTFNGERRTIKKSSTAGLSSVFEYDRPATDVVLTVKALGSSKIFLNETIINSPQCYKVYGIVGSSKYSAC